jgi:hypothetical protein
VPKATRNFNQAHSPQFRGDSIIEPPVEGTPLAFWNTILLIVFGRRHFMAVLTRRTEPVASSDLESIQGVWMSVAGPREARLLIAGKRFTFEFIGGDLYMGTFKLAQGQMDMLIEEGPREYAGHNSLCIYHLDGGVLRWCPGRPGSTRRPESFPDVDDQRFLSLVFRRVRRTNRRS